MTIFKKSLAENCKKYGNTLTFEADPDKAIFSHKIVVIETNLRNAFHKK